MLGLLFLIAYLSGCAVFLQFIFEQEAEKEQL